MKAPYDDLRTFVEELDRKGQIYKVAAELSPRFEIAAALRHLDRHIDQPVLFSSVKGYNIPVIGNLFQSFSSIATAFGLEDDNKAVQF